MFQIIGAIYEILFWPWLVHRKALFNSSKDTLVVVFDWPAGLNTSFLYGRFVLLQNLKDIELIICLQQWFTGNQLICSNSFCPIRALLFKFRQSNIKVEYWSQILKWKSNIKLNLGNVTNLLIQEGAQPETFQGRATRNFSGQGMFHGIWVLW